jgi:hypothetical protein
MDDPRRGTKAERLRRVMVSIMRLAHAIETTSEQREVRAMATCIGGDAIEISVIHGLAPITSEDLE